MTKGSITTITTRGYSVTIPTAAVAGFLALSHDDQVELADVINSLDEDGELVEAAMDDDMNDIIESMAAELDVQDQAIDAYVAERDEARAERKWLAERGLELIAIRDELRGDNYNLNEILVQTANYVGQMRELLGQIGIVIKTDPANGEPLLVFNA